MSTTQKMNPVSSKATVPSTTQKMNSVSSKATIPSTLVWEFAPTGPSADAYSKAPMAPPASEPLSDVVMAALRAHAIHAQSLPRLDARMSAAATDLASVARSGAPLPYSFVQFVFQRYGILGSEPHIIIAEFPTGEESHVASRLPSMLAGNGDGAAYTHVGVGQVPQPGNKIMAVFALQRQTLELQPIPRALPSGGTIVIKGRMLGDWPSFEILVARDDDIKVIAAGSGPTLHVEIPCGQYRGRQWIEIMATDKHDEEDLALFPVWCHQAAPDRIALESPPGNGWTARTAAEVEAELFELLDRERNRRGLPPLARSPEITEAARAHSAAMRDRGFVARALPGVERVEERLTGHRVRLIGPLLARAYDVGEAHAGLMNKPSVRRSLLSSEASQAGIGIALEESAGVPAIYATYILARPRPPVKLIEIRRHIAQDLHRQRPMIEDAELSRLAQEHVDAIIAGASVQDTSVRVSERLDAMSGRYSKVTTKAVAIVHAEDFDAKQLLADTGATHYGLGIALGAHDLLGPDSIWMTFLLATSRTLAR